MTRLFSTTLLCLSLLVGLANAEDPVPPGGASLSGALEAFKKGKYGKAVELASKVSADDVGYAKARYLAGEAHLKLKQMEKAEKAFRDVLKLRPKAVPAMVGLGRSRQAQDDLKEAEALYKAAIKLDRKDAAARRALGELQVRQAKLGKARATLRAAYKLAPADALCARALAEVLLLGGNTKGADKVAAGLIKAKPEHPMGYFLRAVVMERKKQVNKARDLYAQALARDERFLDAHKNLAILLHTNNPEYKNVQMLKDALDHYESYFMLGGSDKDLLNTWRQLQRFVDTELDIDDDDDDDDDSDDQDGDDQDGEDGD